jgi:hypothetical protein
MPRLGGACREEKDVFSAPCFTNGGSQTMPGARCASIPTVVLAFTCAACLCAPFAGGAETGESPAVGKKEARPSPNASAGQGQPVGGLKVLLTLEKQALLEGDSWTGKVAATNVGPKPIVVDTLSGWRTKLVRPDGRAPRLTVHMGAGFIERERNTYFQTIQPGGDLPLATIEAPTQPDSCLAVHLGGLLEGWDLSAGTYRMSVTYTMTPQESERLGMQAAWTGAVESNVVEVTVAERKLPGKPLNGLLLILDLRPYAAAAAQGCSGRARLKNVSDKPVQVDLAASAGIEVRQPDGKVVQGQAMPIPWRDIVGEKRCATIQPGDWVDAAKFHVYEGAMMVQAATSQAYGLAAGEYLVRAKYRCDKAPPGARGPVWTGALESNEERLSILSSRKPR